MVWLVTRKRQKLEENRNMKTLNFHIYQYQYYQNLYRLLWDRGQKRPKNVTFVKKLPNVGQIRPNLPYQNFPSIKNKISTRKPQDLFTYQKLWKFIAPFERHRPKNDNCNQNAQILAQNGQILAISEFSRYTE